MTGVDALRSAFVKICWDLDCFTRADAPCRIPICFAEANSTRKCLAPGVLPSLVVPNAGPAAGPFPPRTGRPSAGTTDDGADRMGVETL
jgi:hypothetical protein